MTEHDGWPAVALSPRCLLDSARFDAVSMRSAADGAEPISNRHGRAASLTGRHTGMLGYAKTHVLILIGVWAALTAVLMPLLGPWGAVFAGAAASQVAYLTARPYRKDAPSLWATGMTFTAIGAIKLDINDWHAHGAAVGIPETVCLAALACVGTLWVVRRVKRVAFDIKTNFKASTAEATAMRERVEAERAQRAAGRPDGYGELGLRRSARLGALTTTLTDHARKVAAAGGPAADAVAVAVADVHERLAKDPGLLPHLRYNLGKADLDENVRAVAAALLAQAEAAGQVPAVADRGPADPA
ncbi:hypothetical protein ACFXDJ_14935 [Streptomyces sp. NPDC059443]|uniref:hypothetical protein n=1 Tax=unclassified Streptomyces TaxID=2593676 RepID=UPI0036775C72